MPKKNAAAVKLGRLGGRAKVAKGFSSAQVLAKALETRRVNAIKNKLKITVDT